jgi:hypothetical protein
MVASLSRIGVWALSGGTSSHVSFSSSSYAISKGIILFASSFRTSSNIASIAALRSRSGRTLHPKPDWVLLGAG